MKPKEVLRQQFMGGVLMLIDGLVASLVGEFNIPQHEAEQEALEMLNDTAKTYREG